MSVLKDYISSLSHLVFPEVCVACQKNIYTIEGAFCFDCYSKLPFSYQMDEPNNSFIAHFKGKINLNHGAALFYFIKPGIIQDLIKKLKYKERSDYGMLFGNIFGKSMLHGSRFGHIDYIIPVPLHHKKFKSRGYNQSEVFAEGISEIIKCGVDTKTLIRQKNTITQTKLSEIERTENVKDAFVLTDVEKLKNKNILLVDDVLTTGSTLLSCGKILSEIKGINISFGTIAMGDLT